DRPGSLRPAAQGHREDARPAAPDLREDRRLWPLRPRRARVQLGAGGQGRRVEGEGRRLTSVKSARRVPRFNAVMNPVLHAVSRLLDSAPGLPGALSAADLSETLSGEPRIRMATRLALVKLA